MHMQGLVENKCFTTFFQAANNNKSARRENAALIVSPVQQPNTAGNSSEALRELMCDPELSDLVKALLRLT